MRDHRIKSICEFRYNNFRRCCIRNKSILKLSEDFVTFENLSFCESTQRTLVWVDIHIFHWVFHPSEIPNYWHQMLNLRVQGRLKLLLRGFKSCKEFTFKLKRFSLTFFLFFFIHHGIFPSFLFEYFSFSPFVICFLVELFLKSCLGFNAFIKFQYGFLWVVDSNSSPLRPNKPFFLIKSF